MFKIFTSTFTLHIQALKYLFISTCSTKELRLHQKLHIEFKNMLWQLIRFINHPAFCNLFISMGQPYCIV